jgi:psiF repeat
LPEFTMRLSAAAAAICLGLSVANGYADAPADKPPAAAPAASTPSDAAAKHAKRTACLKEAKTKKLVGADKTAFLKTCIDSP